MIKSFINFLGFGSQEVPKEPEVQEKKDLEKEAEEKKPKKPTKSSEKIEKKTYILPPELLKHLDSKRKQHALKEGSARYLKIQEMLESPENVKMKKVNAETEKKPEEGKKRATAIDRIIKALDDPERNHLTDADKTKVQKQWEIIANSKIDETDKKVYREMLNTLKDKDGHIFIKINAKIPDEKKPMSPRPKSNEKTSTKPPKQPKTEKK